MRFLLTTFSLLLLAAIVWLTLVILPRMSVVPWIPNMIARWADSEPTFRNFPPYALATFLSTFTKKLKLGLSPASKTAPFGTLQLLTNDQ